MQTKARRIGLSLAMITRILLLLTISWIMRLQDDLFAILGHGFSGHDQDTLANFLAAERPDLLMVGKSRWEPGLVHRLDRETSGLVLVAKTQAAFDDLRLQFRRRQVRKKYWALVWGITESEGAVALSITHDSCDKRRMRVMSDT